MPRSPRALRAHKASGAHQVLAGGNAAAQAELVRELRRVGRDPMETRHARHRRQSGVDWLPRPLGLRGRLTLLSRDGRDRIVRQDRDVGQ